MSSMREKLSGARQIIGNFGVALASTIACLFNLVGVRNRHFNSAFDVDDAPS